MKHKVEYELIETDSQSTVALVWCTVCKKRAHAFTKQFMQVLCEADDCTGPKEKENETTKSTA